MLRATLWSKPSFGMTVIVVLALLPRLIVNVFGVAVRLKFPSGVTVSEIVVLAVSPTDVPVMVTAAVPFFAVELALNVTMLDDVVGFALNDAVTPFGSPETANETFPENSFSGVTLTVLVPLPTPCLIVTAAGAAESVNAGFPVVTVRLSVVLLVNLPDVPMIVNVAVAGEAVALTANVSVLFEVAGLGLNAAVTPLGSPDTFKVTFPLNPPCGIMAIALVPLLPWMMVNALGAAAANVKPGVGSGQLFTRLAAFIVPIPVAKSQPVVVT